VILFFWSCLRDKFTTVTLRTEELEENIQKEITNIPAEHLEMLNENLFRMCVKWIRAEGQHVQYLLWPANFNCFVLLWPANYNCFVLNVIGQQTYWFIAKTRVRFTACSAPVNEGKYPLVYKVKVGEFATRGERRGSVNEAA
jgi:hypothetical protein